MKKFGLISAGVAFVLCIAAGFWILAHAGFKNEDALSTGIGLYFIGKAFFVGPMPVLAVLQFRRS